MVTINSLMFSNNSNHLIKAVKFSFVVLLVSNLFVCCSNQKQAVKVHTTINSPQVSFAQAEIQSALSEREAVTKDENKSNKEKLNILLKIDTLENLKKEGFSMQKDKGKIVVTGVDLAGLMYGGLELAEQIWLYGIQKIQKTTINPHFEMRGPKFNIPLDVRTPSYSDASDAGQKNIPVMWDFAFWKDQLVKKVSRRL